MPGAHDRRMIFVLERGTPEVDQPDLRVQQHSPLTGIAFLRR